MKKVFPILLILSLSAFNSGRAFADTRINPPRPFEELYPEVGYQTVDKAVRAFEHHFNKEVHLPLRIPSVAFTHQFGRFNNLEGNINDSLEIIYINDIKPENHYTINIRPLKYKINFSNKDHKKVYILKDGQKAIYLGTHNFNFFVFENENWQYILGFDNRLSNKITPEMLVEIANSTDILKKENVGLN